MEVRETKGMHTAVREVRETHMAARVHRAAVMGSQLVKIRRLRGCQAG